MAALRSLPLLVVLAMLHPAGASPRTFAVMANGRVMAIRSHEALGSRVRLVLESGGELVIPTALVARIDVEAGVAVPPAGASAVPISPDIPEHPWLGEMQAAASRHALDAKLVYAVAVAESGLDPTARSPRGALGLMQLMPDTAREMGVSDPFDPAQSIEGGCRYLRRLLDRFDGDLSLALAAYNAGPEVVARQGGIPDFPETRAYVTRVLDSYQRL